MQTKLNCCRLVNSLSMYILYCVLLRTANKASFALHHSSCVIFSFDRKLDHPHIVKFFGTALLKKEDEVRVIFVMERCTESLKDHIFKHRESVPGISGKTADLRVCRWAKEITAGLHFMHEVGIIHRDLKLENILVGTYSDLDIFVASCQSLQVNGID